MGLIGSAIGAVGSIFGGIKASKAMKKAKRNVEAQRQKNQDWYDRRYNEDATQRADAQRILTQTEESIKQRNKAAAGSAAVMGGTDESVAAAKAANNQALADATSQIAANAEARKDNIEATYMANDNAFVEQLNQLEQGKAQAIGQAVQGVANAASSMPF
ncbi:hypothetical protein DWZ34_04390 [Phocaeicola plebeius]|uniref:Uncharacterized protein n=1 Tax=Phocaeicola plebeius TaxID=310297 RepID=A0A415TDK2_9BACT|nr:hypothetical protein [Phocaeicola plebeius]RHM99368.1 hypothetical protein DWZ34_04390 [Phocaeicola plebeius]